MSATDPKRTFMRGARRVLQHEDIPYQAHEKRRWSGATSASQSLLDPRGGHARKEAGWCRSSYAVLGTPRPAIALPSSPRLLIRKHFLCRSDIVHAIQRSVIGWLSLDRKEEFIHKPMRVHVASFTANVCSRSHGL